MEGHQATLTHVLPSIDFLLNVYSETLQDNSDNRILSSMIQMGWEKLDKYFAATDRAPVYLAAVVLNPKLKWRYFEVKWDRDWLRVTGAAYREVNSKVATAPHTQSRR